MEKENGLEVLANADTKDTVGNALCWLLQIVVHT